MVLELYAKGYSQSQIAVQLGVSAKTVFRDLKKIHNFSLGRASARLRKADEEFQRKLQEKLDLLPKSIQFEIVTDLFALSILPKTSKNIRALFEATRKILLGTYKPKRVLKGG
jgi:transcriptional antiterminator